MRAVDIHRVAAAARVASGGLVVCSRSTDLHTRYLNLTLTQIAQSMKHKF